MGKTGSFIGGRGCTKQKLLAYFIQDYVFWLCICSFFFSLELDDTSDEFSSSGSEVEMKVAKPRKKAVPASPVSFAFSSCINVDGFLFLFNQDLELSPGYYSNYTVGYLLYIEN